MCLGDGSSGRPGQRRQAHHPGSGGQLLISVTLYSHSNQVFAASLVPVHSGLCSQTADRKTLTSVTGHIFRGSCNLAKMDMRSVWTVDDEKVSPEAPHLTPFSYIYTLTFFTSCIFHICFLRRFVHEDFWSPLLVMM